jgi:hypothetical protein
MRVFIAVAVTLGLIAVSAPAFVSGLSSSPEGVASAPGHSPRSRFEPSSACLACHNGLTAASGEDVSIGAAWRGSMMANSARDPYWQASVRRETLDNPTRREAIEDGCAACHMPMARADAAASGRRGEVFAHLPIGGSARAESALAADGVSCTLCHQIAAQKLGHRDTFSGHFLLEPLRVDAPAPLFGPFAVDAGRQMIMRSASGFQPTESAHVRQSELCASCHTLYTTAVDASGAVVGRLPEQTPYLEWRHSAYRDQQSCQSCHMPPAPDDTAFSSVWGESRRGWARHSFRGANVFMLRMLNRYRDELGVQASPGELDTAARVTLSHLQEETARVSIERVDFDGDRVVADVAVRNLAGHKLPTGYPSRRAWLHVTIRDAAGRVVFESGAMDRRGAIVANDNDRDGTRAEPHYQAITSGDQVQIYESIMVDATGAVTTALARGVRFVKDNRILPRGFDKERAEPDIAVQGSAAEDTRFAGGGHTVRYDVPVETAGAPFSVGVELLYQPIAFRWAQNLTQQRAAEITRFVGWYDAMADSSSVRLASTTAIANRRP